MAWLVQVFTLIFFREMVRLLNKHLQDLYKKLSGMAVQSKGLSLVPKLKSEHINLTSFSRMRVDLAA